MVCIAYSRADETSRALGERVINILGVEETEPIGSRRHFSKASVEVVEFNDIPLYEENIDSLVKTDLFVFLSRHKSSKGVPSFTIHSLGNWAPSSEAGGKPRMLSMAAPWQMRNMLVQMATDNRTDVPVTYEATHHGPLLNTPSFFVEVGGSEKITDLHYDTLAEAVCNYVSSEHENVGKIAVAIGGTHYPAKFTKLALDGKYAFSHIMPRHACTYADMLQQGIERSAPRAECAVIEWKGIAPAEREIALKKLSELGIDYVRV